MAGTYQPKVLSSDLTTRPPPSASLLVLATKGHKQCVCCTVTEPFLLYIAVWPGFHLKHRTLSTKLIALHQVIYKKCNLFSVFPCSVKKCSISFLFPNRSSFLHFCCFGIYLSLGEDLQPRHSAGGRWQNPANQLIRQIPWKLRKKNLSKLIFPELLSINWRMWSTSIARIVEEKVGCKLLALITCEVGLAALKTKRVWKPRPLQKVTTSMK